VRGRQRQQHDQGRSLRAHARSGKAHSGVAVTFAMAGVPTLTGSEKYALDCLAASFDYQDPLFNREVRELNAGGMLSWGRRFRARLDRIAEHCPPRQPINLWALSDMVSALVEAA
jgi:hypothetical protein